VWLGERVYNPFDVLLLLQERQFRPWWFHGEGYWASVFYSHLASLGLDLIPEDVTHQGRIDLTLRLPQAIVIMEFKRIDGDQPTGEAMAQRRQRGYADQYRADGRPIWLLGVEFSSATRNVVGWDVASA